MGVDFAEANGLTIAYERFGEPAAPPVLLIAGVGAQLISWPEGFCEELAGRGHHVVRFDNRDVGESSRVEADYTLSDMAADAAGLLGALGHASAHVVGLSMGGMIAQTVALEHAERVRSLTSIMSTTGDSKLPQATAEAQAVLFGPAARSREELMERVVEGSRVLGSPGFETDEDYLRERAGRAWDRGYDPAGFKRQLAAIYASGSRARLLPSLRVPALVIHGEEDPLIRVEAGRATAAAIEGAELVTIPGMGHDLPRAAWPQIVEPISALVERAERERVPA